MDSGNLQWLLHRKLIVCDYDTCEKIIEHQMISTNDHEYLYFVKVTLFHFVIDPFPVSLLHLLKGIIAKEKGKYQEALKHFHTTVDFGSKNPLHYKEIGKTLSVHEKCSFNRR